MDRHTSFALTGALALCPGTGSGQAATAAPDGAAQTARIVSAATDLLAMVTAETRAALRLPFDRPAVADAAHFKGGPRGDVDMVGERFGAAVWSNFPVSDVQRPGSRLGALSRRERDMVMGLLGELLSARGYRKVQDIMGSDQALAEMGQPYDCGRATYTVAIFGEPNPSTPWMVQFGGHHLALNVVIAGARSVLAPVLTGCLPALYSEDGRHMRALGAENDKAFDLLDSMTESQRRDALIDHDVSDLVLGPGHDGEMPKAAGIAASRLAGPQRAALYELILEWAGLLNDIHAAPRLSEIRAGLNETRFAWSGPMTREAGHNGAAYFRIQGPTLFIEYAPQRPGGDLTMHAHTIYRDIPNAYGRLWPDDRGSRDAPPRLGG